MDPLSFKPNSVISKRTVDLKGIVGKLREDGTLELDMKNIIGGLEVSIIRTL
ncbi:hypothetical protein [Saccharolobus islandicus]|uniref:hypothetical protein n=1 Tax=Saccharolobus islandicus TaxID=43080 RepID=UPI000373934B|nr:hypothetical protein [Sulfolobus islandicus]